MPVHDTQNAGNAGMAENTAGEQPDRTGILFYGRKHKE